MATVFSCYVGDCAVGHRVSLVLLLQRAAIRRIPARSNSNSARADISEVRKADHIILGALSSGILRERDRGGAQVLERASENSDIVRSVERYGRGGSQEDECRRRRAHATPVAGCVQDSQQARRKCAWIQQTYSIGQH